MSKNGKILLSLVVLAILLIIFLVLRSKPLAQVPPQNEEAVKKVDLEQLEKNYKKETKAILQEYSGLIKKDDLRAEELRAVRDKLLALKVPAKFKDLHLNLVLALAKEENLLVGGNKEGGDFSQEAINEIKANYSWLN